MVSVTRRSLLRSTSTSLTKRKMRSTAPAGPVGTIASRSAMTRRCMNRMIMASCVGGLERDRGCRCLRAVLELEERLLAEAQRAGKEIVGKRLDADVEVARGAVVVAARHLQLILDLGQLLLQAQEILVGLEARIGLGDREQLAERSLQQLLRRGAARDVAGRQARLPPRRDLLEDSTLVRRIALHGLDQVGNQIRAALELHVHSAPGLARKIAQPHQPVEDENHI